MSDCVESLSCVFQFEQKPAERIVAKTVTSSQMYPMFSICGIYGFMEYIRVIINRGNKCFKLDRKN